MFTGVAEDNDQFYDSAIQLAVGHAHVKEHTASFAGYVDLFGFNGID